MDHTGSRFVMLEKNRFRKALRSLSLVWSIHVGCCLKQVLDHANAARAQSCTHFLHMFLSASFLNLIDALEIESSLMARRLNTLSM